jgi:hypothetical protein
MTHHTITDIDRITSALDLKGAIEHFIWDQLTDGCYWESVSQIIAQLESAACVNGSWGGMIYTREILDRLSDPQWVDDIDTALEEYADATGETFDFSALSETVTFAVDWVAHRLASRLRHLDRVAVVIAWVDVMDSHPDVIAFDTVWEAEDWVAEEVERRVQHQVDHSPHPVTEDDREAMTENEIMLFELTEERL